MKILVACEKSYPDYVQRSIERLKAFEPPEGYFVAFSGGKDSQCIYHLCELAGVKFDAHYSVTSVDPPELVRFIKSHYPSVSMEIPRDKDGKPITMWSLIANRSVPPTRRSRYCCTELKECNGRGRITVTGVRWAESKGRTENRGQADIDSKSKKLQKTMEENGADFRIAKAGHIVLNDDNDINRRMVEQCYRTHKTMVNPIVDWTDKDVWNFLKNVAKVESCSLYAEGFDRLGCIGCPLASKKNRIEEFKRWPKYKKLYLKAFERMIEKRTEHRDDEWKTPEEVFDWWMETGVLPGQMRMDELIKEEIGDEDSDPV